MQLLHLVNVWAHCAAWRLLHIVFNYERLPDNDEDERNDGDDDDDDNRSWRRRRVWIWQYVTLTNYITEAVHKERVASGKWQ